MKKYITFVLILTLGFSAFSQTTKDDQLGASLNRADSILQQLQNDINNFLETSQMFKWEGNERPIVTGFLKEIFTDSTMKYRYAEVNPAIAKMYIMDRKVVFDSCTYQKWIESIPVITDFDTYEFLYSSPSDMPPGETAIESIYLFNKKTRKNERIISIHYIDECLVSISDSERTLFEK